MVIDEGISNVTYRYRPAAVLMETISA